MGNEQWCFKAISTADEKTECSFETMSNKNYTVSLYCQTIEGWWY